MSSELVGAACGWGTALLMCDMKGAKTFNFDACRGFFLLHKTTTAARIATNKRPPTTPPAIGPALDEEVELLLSLLWPLAILFGAMLDEEIMMEELALLPLLWPLPLAVAFGAFEDEEALLPLLFPLFPVLVFGISADEDVELELSPLVVVPIAVLSGEFTDASV